MERRMMLAALGAVIAAPAIAQTTTPQTPTMTAPPSPGMPTPGQMPSDQSQGTGQMGRSETTHAERTMKLGAVSLATSRIAVEKATNPRVKMFAQFEVAEQETIADILRSMKQTDPVTTGSVRRPTDEAVRAELDERGRRMVEEMSKMGRGADFDRDYVQAQIRGHRELLDAQEDYLRAGRNREHISMAKLARGHIKEHIATLEMIQGELGRRG